MVRLIEKREGDLNMRAGILVSNGLEILGCLPTPTVQYPNFDRLLDLPKGHMRVGETPIQSAIRETLKETGILFEEAELDYVDKFSLYGEPFFLFRTYMPELKDVKNLHCPSTFQNKMIVIPENSNYELVHYSKIKDKFFPELVPCIRAGIRK